MRFKASYLLWLILIALLIPHVIDFFIHSWEVLDWEWQIDYDEGFNLDAAWKLSNGRNIYGPSTPDYFLAAPYGPVYFLVCALFLKFFGLSMLGGRLITFLASVVIALLLGVFSQQFATTYFKVSRINSFMGGVVAGLLWLSINPSLVWGTLFKPDMLAIALSLGGLVLTWKSLRRIEILGAEGKVHYRINWYGYFGAGLVAMAFFTKQTELAMVGVGILYVLIIDWRAGLQFGVVLSGFILIPFIGLDLLTNHRFFFEMFVSQQVPWIWDDFRRRLTSRVFPDHPAMLLTAVAYMLLELRRAVIGWRLKQLYRPSLLIIWLAASTFTLITVGSYQSGYNHALDFFPPLIVIFGALAALAIEKVETKLSSLLGWVCVVGLIWVLGWQTLSYPEWGFYFSAGGMPSAARQQMYEGLIKQIEAAPGDILSEDIYLQLKLSRPVVYGDLYHAALQADAGQWDESKFLADLRERRFSLILLGLGSRRFTDKGWEALNANFSLIFPDGLSLWRPRPRPLSPQVSYDCRVGDSLSFGGVSYGEQTGKTTDKITITTYWQAGKPVPQNYTFFVHLVDSNGKIVAQRDEQPGGWKISKNENLDLSTQSAQLLPTNAWKSGETVAVDQTLPLPAGISLQSGYRLGLGAYLIKADNSLENLAVSCGNPSHSSGTIINLPGY